MNKLFWQMSAALTAFWVALMPLCAQAAEVDPLVPKDAVMVMTVNIDRLIQAEAVKKHALGRIKDAIKTNTEATQILSQLSLDWEKDLKTLTVALSGELKNVGGGNPLESMSLAVIVRGKFAPEKFDELAKEHPDRVTTHKSGNHTIYETKDGEQPMFAAFVGKEAAVLSNKRNLVEDCLAGKKQAGVNKDLQSAVRKVSGEPTAWFAMAVPDQLRDLMKASPQAAELAEKLEAFTLTATVKSNIVVELGMHMKDRASADKAKLILDQVKAFLTLAALQNEKAGPILNNIINAAKVETQNNVAALRAEITAQQLEELIKLAQ